MRFALPSEARPRDRSLIYFDVTRTLVFRALTATPTGIDRIEAAYARFLLDAPNIKTRFVASSVNELAFLPRRRVRGVLGALTERWGGTPSAVLNEHSGPATQRPNGNGAGVAVALPVLWARLLMSGAGIRRREGPVESTYLKVAHEGLENPRRYRRFKRQTRCRFVIYLHDLIPLRYPQYVRPRSPAIHAERIAFASEIADLVLVNSEHTRRDLSTYCRENALREPPIAVIEPAVDDAFLAPAPSNGSGKPYFVCVGTIEPRKNHLLLLNLWQELSRSLGAQAPDLVLIGRNGWENEHILRSIRRAGREAARVRWHENKSDSEIAALLSGARALLLPSFAEGYGIPVAEALALGTPVICSDLPALREAGQNVPLFLSPRDAAAWHRAVLDFAQPESASRAAQLQQMRQFRPVTWEAHFASLRKLLGFRLERPAQASLQEQSSSIPL
jgi:glycosyltransferase involved in cell wall biosynthesis